MDEAPLSGLRPHNLHYAKLPPACFLVALPLSSCPRPPSLSGYAESRYTAPFPLTCHASHPPQGGSLKALQT